MARLPESIDEATVVARAAAAGIGIEGITPYRVALPGSGGLLFGYGAVSEALIQDGIRRIATILDED